MATIPTYSQEYSDNVAQQNLNNALSGVRDTQTGNTSSAYTQPAGPTAPALDPQSIANINAFNANLAAPSPSPAPAPVGPDRNTELERIKNEALSIQDILNQRSTAGAGGEFNSGGYEEVYEPEPFDEEEANRLATRNQMKLYQAQIDATNQVYDQLLNEARVQGTGRLGSQRAGAARGGLLGSDFANSQKSTVQGFNTDIQRGIGAERTAAIGNIMGQVRSSVLDEVRAKREAREAGVEEYMDFLNRRDERRGEFKDNFIRNAITQGIDITQFSEEELAEYMKGSGIKPADLLNSYRTAVSEGEAAGAAADLETRKTEAEIDKIEADIASGKIIKLAEGNMLYNQETGETFKNPKTYKPSTGSASDSFGGLSNTDEKSLLGGGWSQSDINALAEGVSQYGLEEVIQKEREGGATPGQIQALQKVYGQEASSPNFLSKDYFKSTFSGKGLEEAAAAAGFGDMGEGLWNLKDVDTDAYLDSLEANIEAYRQAGYDDREILEMMQ